MAHGNHRHGVPQQIEPFRIAPRVKIVHQRAFNCPTALAVAEGGYRSRRTQQNRILPHLSQEFGAQNVAANPRFEKRLAGERWLCRRPLEELLQNWAKVVFAALKHGANQHPSGGDEEFLPQHSCFLKSFRTKWFNLKSSASKRLRRSSHRNASLRSHRRAAVVLEIPDAQFLGFVIARPP